MRYQVGSDSRLFAHSEGETFFTTAGSASTPTNIAVTLKNYTGSSSIKTGTTDSTATIRHYIYVSGIDINNLKKANNGVGIKVYDSSGQNLLGEAKDISTSANPITVDSAGYVDTWYTIGAGKNVNYSLAPATTYKYRFFVRYNGIDYYSDFKSFTTTGSSPTVAKTLTYNGHTYERYDSSLSWTAAEAFCEAKGGHLLTILDSAEQNQIKSNLLSGAAKNYYWIGGTDTEQKGTWKWITGETFWTGGTNGSVVSGFYANWDPDAPEPNGRDGEDYAAIMGKNVGTRKQIGEWIDVYNTGDTGNTDYALAKGGFICEYDPATYLVKYDSNGGSWSQEKQIKTHDVALKLYSSVPNRANGASTTYTVNLDANGGKVSSSALSSAVVTSFSFNHWNTAINGTGNKYYPSENYTSNADVTLYAQWDKIISASAVTLPTPTREGYAFNGWATSSSATSGTTGKYTPAENVTLYAVWIPVTYAITYNPNNGTGAPGAQSKMYGQPLSLSTIVPTRGGYYFLGWAESADAEAAVYLPGGSFTKDTDTILYAVWAQSDFVLPAMLTTIEMDAFANCAFRFVEIPQNTTAIQQNAFANCTNLADICISNAAAAIDPGAFGNLQNLTILGKEGSTAQAFAQQHGYTFLPIA